MAFPPPLPSGSDGQASGPPALPTPVPPDLPTIDAADKPVTATKTPPVGRKFPCKQCGAKLDFDPAARGLKCPYCGFTEVIAPVDESTRAEAIKEHDLEQFLATQEEAADATIQGHSSQVTCTGCGAVIMLEDKVLTEACPYCNTHLENKPEAVEHLIAPESVLPFAISLRAAQDKFNTWISSLWFAPSELKKLANLGKFNSIYCPYWTYDAMTYTSYQGQRGDNYTETESYTDSNGNRQTRSVTKTRWYSVSGEVEHFFDDVLIRAAKTLPGHLVEKLNPWNLQSLEPFKDDFLSGHQAERYSVSLIDGYGQAKLVMADYITSLIRRDIGGDHQRISWQQTQHVAVTFKHTLLPIWIANYRYREKLFQVLVNGESGRVAGDRPYSWVKIISLIISILLAIVLIVVVVKKSKGTKVSSQQKVTVTTEVQIFAKNHDQKRFVDPFFYSRGLKT